MTFPGLHRFSARQITFTLLFCAAITLIGTTAPWRAHSQGGNPVTVVSAASFVAPVAPESIAAAFGSRLAPRAEAATSQPAAATAPWPRANDHGNSRIRIFLNSIGEPSDSRHR